MDPAPLGTGPTSRAETPHAKVLDVDHQTTLLRYAREDAGLSIRDAAALLGVTAQTVWNWEHGRARPYPSHERAIEELLLRLTETEESRG